MAQAQQEAEAIGNAKLDREGGAAQGEVDAEQEAERRAAPDEEEHVDTMEAAESQRQSKRDRHAAVDDDEREEERAENAMDRPTRRRKANRISRAACSADSVLSGEQKVAACDMGRRDTQCRHCNALLWHSERAQTTLCCCGGKVKLEPLPAPPPLLRDLWTADTLLARTFRKHVQHLNTALALSRMSQSRAVSSGCTAREVQPEDRGFAPYVIIQCDDPAAEAAMRLKLVPLLEPEERTSLLDLFGQLQVLLRDINPYVQDFIHAAKLLEEEVQQKRLVIRADMHSDHDQRYNHAEGFREVVVLKDDKPVYQDIELRRLPGAGLDCEQTVNERHRAFEALHFVLLLPFGTDECQPRLQEVVGRGRRGKVQGVNLMQYYAHRLHERPGMDDSLLRAGRLLQEFVCMAFARVENRRLLHYAKTQTAIRAELNQRLEDGLPGDAEEEVTIGERIVLPAGFVGGPRHYEGQYRDAMAIVRVWGQPPFYIITFTCNTNWPEIQAALLPGQDVQSRPDLVARVFRQKLTSLLNELNTDSIFGRCVSMLMVVKFQKRGLPHSHILLCVRPEDRPRTPEDINAIISAELPDPAQSAQAHRLHDIVVGHMVHRQCGAAHLTAGCMEHGRCTKGFPKPYAAETEWRDDHPYPVYRRRPPVEGVQEVVCGDRIITNQWVEPYCPYLSLRYNAYINVEVCCSVKSAKHLLRDIYKGPVRAGNPIGGKGDEINDYQKLPSIGDIEACWRLFSMSTTKRLPTVVALQAHLPPDKAAQPEISGDKEPTQLTAWLEYNRQSAAADSDCLELLYPEFPKRYTWQAGPKKWKKRDKCQAKETIGRVVRISPRHGEVFYLRVLLHHVRGAKTFKALRTIGGVVCDTYREACRLLDDQGGQVWEDTMQDAAHDQMPAQLRRLFCTILLSCGPAEPPELFERHRDAMSEDIAHDHPGLPVDLRADLVLIQIEQQLRRSGKELHHFRLPEVTPEQRARASELELDATQG